MTNDLNVLRIVVRNRRDEVTEILKDEKIASAKRSMFRGQLIAYNDVIRLINDLDQK